MTEGRADGAQYKNASLGLSEIEQRADCGYAKGTLRLILEEPELGEDLDPENTASRLPGATEGEGGVEGLVIVPTL
jgi:hypothetical protein